MHKLSEIKDSKIEAEIVDDLVDLDSAFEAYPEYDTNK